MPDVEPLGDVDGRIVDADGLPRAFRRGTVLFAHIQHLFHNGLRIAALFQEEIEVAAHALHPFNVLIG